MRRCDVLVVGAGPAGSSAARACALSQADVVVVEKKASIGVPVQCAEGVGRELIRMMPMRIPRRLLKWKTKGVYFWIYGVGIPRVGGEWEGYSINRDEFDQWLAKQAVDEGAELMLASELISLDVSSGKVTEAEVKTPEGRVRIKPRVVIAADGVEFRVLRLLGRKVSMKGNCGYVLGYELDGLSIEEPEFEHVFMGDFAPSGYGYLFPKSESRANVGVGMLFPKKSYLEYYREFMQLSHVRRQTTNARVVAEKSGWAPYRYMCEWVIGNVVFAGDAANQNFKLLVEGFAPAIICGDIAGKLAAEHCSDGIDLAEYRERVMDRLGEYFRVSDKILEVSYSLMRSAKKKDLIIAGGIGAGLFSPDEVKNLRRKSEGELINMIKSACD